MPIQKILMVDDEPDIRKIGQLSLRNVGKWSVSVAGSAEEALALIHERPDVILLDVMMPEMDGPALLVKLRELPETARTPVIFMTAKVQKVEVERYQALGAAGVIIKPFDPMALPSQIQNLVNLLGPGAV